MMIMKRGKRKAKEKVTFLMLPNDLLLNCLARVSRLYHPALSLVSKRFQSLIASLELYVTRTLLGCNQSCLYVTMLFPDKPTTRCFTLSLRSTQTDPKPSCFPPWLLRTYKKTTSYGLVSVKTLCAPSYDWSDLVASGCSFYKVGSSAGSHEHSYRVMFLDCRSHTWNEAPRMKMVRNNPCVSVLGGKIYVAGGNVYCDSSNWIEVFNPETQTWEREPSPHDSDICKSSIYKSWVIDGKLYLFGKNNHGQYRVVCKATKEAKWDVVLLRDAPFISHNPRRSSCVIDNVLYIYVWRKIFVWYDFDGRFWRELKGLEGLPKLKLPREWTYVRLLDYGGKMAVLWESEEEEAVQEKKLWFAKISLKRRNKVEIYGKVEWCGVVLTVPKSCVLLQFLAAYV